MLLLLLAFLIESSSGCFTGPPGYDPSNPEQQPDDYANENYNPYEYFNYDELENAEDGTDELETATDPVDTMPETQTPSQEILFYNAEYDGESKFWNYDVTEPPTDPPTTTTEPPPPTTTTPDCGCNVPGDYAVGPDCTSFVLKDIIDEAIYSAEPDLGEMSKQIQEQAQETFTGDFHVICAPNDFSFRFWYSGNKMCKTNNGEVWCTAWRD